MNCSVIIPHIFLSKESFKISVITCHFAFDITSCKNLTSLVYYHKTDLCIILLD